MPRLILLNGPPGCGKSTVAQLFVADHPLALSLDIDRVRGLLGRWREQATRAGVLARAMSLAMAHTHLSAGYDVVVPQYLGDIAFIQQVERTARQVGAAFHELVLLDSKDNSVRRFLTRSAATGLPAHQEAQEMLDRAGGLPVLETMYDRLMDVIAARPDTHVIATEDGHISQTYRAVLLHLST